MTRDYARSTRPQTKYRNTRVAPSRKSAPGWVWLFAGILIGTLATGVFHYSRDTAKPTDTIATEKTAPPEKEPVPASHKPRFDFYTLLKETEVVVAEENGEPPPKTVELTVLSKPGDNSNDEKSAEKPTDKLGEQPAATPVATDKSAEKPAATAQPQAQKPAATPTTTSSSKTVYVLQAGSFKNPTDADNVRARLLLLNMHATIERVTTSSNETWHRVLIGPYTDSAEAARAKSILSQNGIQSIQLKRWL